jgi:sortase A
MKPRFLALIGELAVLAGIVVLLQAVYQIWITNFESDQKALQVSERLIAEFSKAPETLAADPQMAPEKEKHGGFALLYIPALKEDVWALPILKDVTEDSLSKGAGHYPATAMPGEVGNFAIAAHRATYGEPFAYFERLNAGDRVIVQTAEGFYIYRLFADKKIQTTEVWVISEQPTGVVTTPKAIITLTTCDPRWNSTQRWARWGELIEFSETVPEELNQP